MISRYMGHLPKTDTGKTDTDKTDNTGSDTPPLIVLIQFQFKPNAGFYFNFIHWKFLPINGSEWRHGSKPILNPKLHHNPNPNPNPDPDPDPNQTLTLI